MGDALRVSSPEMAPQSINEPVVQSVDMATPQRPMSADLSLGTRDNEHILREDVNDAEEQNLNIGNLPSPQENFNRMMDKFRNTWNRKKDSSEDNKLTEPEPTFIDKLPKKIIIKRPIPFKKPLSKFRSSDINENSVIGDGSPLESNMPEIIKPDGLQNELVSKNADVSLEKSAIVKAVDPDPNPMQKFSLKEMAQKIMDDYKYGRKGVTSRQGVPNIADSNSNARETNTLMQGENMGNIDDQMQDFSDRSPTEDEIVFIQPDARVADANNEKKIVIKNQNLMEESNNNGEILPIEDIDDALGQPESNGEKEEPINSGASVLTQNGREELPSGRETTFQRLSTTNSNNPGESLGQSRADNVKSLLDAGPFVSRGRELYHKYLADQMRRNDAKNGEIADTKLGLGESGNNFKPVDEKPFISRGRELYKKYLDQQKRLDAIKNNNVVENGIVGESIGNKGDSGISSVAATNTGTWPGNY